MDRARTIVLQLRDFFLALPPARRVSFAVLTGGILVATLALALWVQRPQWAVLFANLDGSDAGAVVDYLKAEKIPYRIGDGGSSIEVSQGKVYELRMLLAGRGIPQGGGGVGFEIFDKQTLGMTDFVQRLDYQRALQGELARTIAGLAAVEGARVHLALPERSLFVTQERHPSASVVVKLRPGRKLSQEQVAGIVHLVAASVEGLKPAAVTIVDTGGTVLTTDRDDAGDRGVAEAMRSQQKEIEQGYVDRVESMLERVLGPGHAVARATVTLDLAQVEKTEEVFDPDRTALKSERRNSEKSAAAGPSGVPGVTATLTNEPAPPQTVEGPQSEREDSVRSYEITKVTSRRIEPMGGIRKLTIAVLVDGVAQGEGATKTFVPRPAEEIERYKELVKRVVGFNAERGDEIEMVSAPFQTAAVEPIEAPSLLARLAGWSDGLWRVAGLAVVLLVALMVVRPFLLAMVDRAPVAAPRAAVATVETTSSPQVREIGRLTEIARQHPVQTALVIKQWVTGEGEG